MTTTVASQILAKIASKLQRFHECITDFDAGGHDLSSGELRVLEGLGLLIYMGRNIHEITELGQKLLDELEGV